MADPVGHTSAPPAMAQRPTDAGLDDVAATAKSTAREAMNKASDLASHAADSVAGQAQGLVEGQVRSAADMAGSFAEAVHVASDKLAETSPDMAKHVRQLADTLQGLAGQMRDQSVGDLMQGVNTYARQQPTTFFAAATLAGFMAARFLKSSRPEGNAPAGTSGSSVGPSHAGQPRSEPVPQPVRSFGSEPPAGSVPGVGGSGALHATPGSTGPGVRPTPMGGVSGGQPTGGSRG